jgi:hypothetical protein
MILDACRAGKRTNLELQSVLFPRDLDPHQTSFAFSETLAHVNMLVRRKALERTVTEGVARYSTTGSTGSAQN